MLQPSSLCYAVPSLKRRIYEAFCGICRKIWSGTACHEAHLRCMKRKPWQASFTIFAKQKWWRRRNFSATFSLCDFLRSKNKKVRRSNTIFYRELQNCEKSLVKAKIVKMQCRGLILPIFWNLQHFGNYDACDHITAYPNKIQTKENIIIEITCEIAKYKNFSLSCFCFWYRETNLLHVKNCIGKRKAGYP